jgi:hypothetical protein
MNLPDAERRREEREAVSGDVTIVLDGTPPTTLRGVLVDISKSGFRVRHTFPDLACGSQVSFEHPAGRGRARVIWNRYTRSACETGFLFVDPAGPLRQPVE